MIDRGIQGYVRLLNLTMRRRVLTVCSAIAVLAVVVTLLCPRLRREFFPEVDAGAFEIYVRDTTGTRIEVTEGKIAQVENMVRDSIQGDLQLIISELGVTADWSAAYTPNSGPMDAVVKVQLHPERKHSATATDQRREVAVSHLLQLLGRLH